MISRAFTILTVVWRDVRVAGRMLAKRKPLAIATIATLGGAIGVATAAFSTADGVILRPLPVHDQNRLVVLWGRDRADSSRRLPLPFATHKALAESSPGRFAEVAAHHYAGAFLQPIREGADASNLNLAVVTGNLFRVLGVEAVHGRRLQPDDDHPGAAPVVVISHGLWHGRYAGDPSVIGRVLHLQGRAATIVGIMPRGFAILLTRICGRRYSRSFRVTARSLPTFTCP